MRLKVDALCGAITKDCSRKQAILQKIRGFGSGFLLFLTLAERPFPVCRELFLVGLG